MGAPELTPEVKHDLQVLRMRSVLDPKHFYKKNDLKALPRYFQIGKIIDTPVDYYSGRLTKKERKKTIVDELMADAQFSKYNKRKYKEIIEEKKKLHYKAHKHAKKLKRGRKK
ncbi:Deoxynucleotidyltransferase terminal-interacting protein 2 [Anthophora plagiata]